jgi:hypothetical protein
MSVHRLRQTRPTWADVRRAADWFTDDKLLGKTFGGPTFLPGRTLVASLCGEPLTPEMLALYQACTGRAFTPRKAAQRGYVIAGRGSGKTLISAGVVVMMAASRDWHAVTGPGELVTAAIVCPDRRQARVAMRYVRGLLRQSPMLERLIVNETRESIELSTGCVIEVHTASFKSTRGYSFCVVVVDEAAFLPTDHAANPDVELVRAVAPGLARVPGSLLLVISSPYARRGVLWDAHARYYGVDDPESSVLVWQADTRTMNSTIDQSVVDEALVSDSASAQSEWLGRFRSDLESYIDSETLDRCIVPGRAQCAPVPGTRYICTFDAALGGTVGGDSFTGCVGHYEGDVFTVDHLVEIRPKFNPNTAIDQLVGELVRPYGGVVYSDRFAKAFVTDRLRHHGVLHRATDFDRSSAYLAALPQFTAGRVALLDPSLSVVAERCINQFRNLQRRTGARGKDAIDHPRGGHDDIANVVALAIAQASTKRRSTAPPPLLSYGSLGYVDREHRFHPNSLTNLAASETRAAQQQLIKQYSRPPRVYGGVSCPRHRQPRLVEADSPEALAAHISTWRCGSPNCGLPSVTNTNESERRITR